MFRMELVTAFIWIIQNRNNILSLQRTIVTIFGAHYCYEQKFDLERRPENNAFPRRH